MKAFFLTFEGLDFSGKTTQARRLIERLQRVGVEPLFLREPGGTDISEAIRHILLDVRHREMHPRTELFLYSAARAQMVEQVIRPALEQGRMVICDRYYDSTTAYQGYGRGLDLNLIQTLNDFATGSLRPDLTILLDIPVEVAFQRRRKSEGDGDRLEQEVLEFHQRVRKGYLNLARQEPIRFVVIDGCATPDSVHTQVWEAVRKVLAPHFKAVEEL